jgi:DNA-directed RNA polymerase specialized sigma24 family protein
MRKTKEVLRLRYELGLGQRAIARSCSISQGAVHNYLKKATAAQKQSAETSGRSPKIATRHAP